MNTIRANPKPRRLTRLAHMAGPLWLVLAVALSLTSGISQAKTLAATAPGLGKATSFSVLGASTVTNTGPSVVTGDLGVNAGNAVTGFPPGRVIGGTIHAADAVSLQAKNDATKAYNQLAGQSCDEVLTGDLGNRILNPGVYCFSSSAQLTGQLTLNAGGNSNAVFVFRIGSALTTASASSVIMTNGGSACNVFWQVGSSATLGTASAFAGNILANASITLNTGANLAGRALAFNGAVTLDTNHVTGGGCAGPGGCTPDGWPMVGEGFVNGVPVDGLWLRFNLVGWDYSYWEATTAATTDANRLHGFTQETKFPNTTVIAGATWVPNAAFNDTQYVLGHVEVDGGVWNIAGGSCTDLVVRVYVISKTPAAATATASALTTTPVPAAATATAAAARTATAAALTTTPVAGATAAPILIPATGADLAGEQTLVSRRLTFLGLGCFGLGLVLIGLVLGRKPRG